MMSARQLAALRDGLRLRGRADCGSSYRKTGESVNR
jgi:hypothetical protein